MLDSCFTLTFAVEVLAIEESLQNDNNSVDWIELGPSNQGLRLHYSLYQGYSYDLDLLMWPNAGKIWCGNRYGWVRTWQFFNKHWMVFTIRHKFPVKVEEFRFLEIIISPSLGTGSFGNNAKNDKDFLIMIPPLEFGELRYFGKILESDDEGIIKSIINSIWKNVIKYIPASCFDGAFDTPLLVTDVRHQDAILGYIRETMLTSNLQLNRTSGSGDMAHLKDKGKKSSPDAESYKLKITGEVILGGSGRLNRFLEVGHRSPLQGSILAVVSASNLPAQDDLPIMFVNIKTLKSLPADELQKAGIEQIYTRWTVGKTQNDSVLQNVTTETKVKFNDNHIIPIEKSLIFEVFNALMDNGFDVQLRGVRRNLRNDNIPNFFGTQLNYTSGSRNDMEQDILIASTRIDVRELSKGSNKMISGEFSMYPEKTEILDLKTDCTNYINAMSSLQKNKFVFQPHVVLNSQMTIRLTVGLLGCEINLPKCFSRLYALANSTKVVYDVLENIEELNQRIRSREESYLTGFYLDTGDKHFIFVEGEKNKDIIKLWEEIESYYPNVTCSFSSSDTYLERIYPEMVTSNRQFDVFKMRVSLSSLLACPPVYALPALPLPARTAMIKISQIISGKLNKTPSRREMPTAPEWRSFKLELCAPIHSYVNRDFSFNFRYD